MPALRACLIDVYDTILSAPFAPRAQALAAPLGIAAGDWIAAWDRLQEERNTGRITVADSFARTLRALGVEPAPGLVASLLERDGELFRSSVVVYADTVPFLRRLRREKVVTALVSNCEETTRARLAWLGLLPLADAVILSCEVGSVKPFPGIYAAALEELGVPAEEAVFLDDQPRYCAGAQAAGIRPVQIAREQPGGCISPWGFPVAGSLGEALALL